MEVTAATVRGLKLRVETSGDETNVSGFIDGDDDMGVDVIKGVLFFGVFSSWDFKDEELVIVARSFEEDSLAVSTSMRLFVSCFSASPFSCGISSAVLSWIYKVYY